MASNVRYLKSCSMRWILAWAGLGLGTLPTDAWADINIEQVPTAWRLQQYGPNSAVAYYTASTCAGGQLSVPTNYSADDISRFWATVMTARALGQVIGIYYDNSTPACYITSYYLRQM